MYQADLPQKQCASLRSGGTPEAGDAQGFSASVAGFIAAAQKDLAR